MAYQKLKIQCEDIKVGDIFIIQSGNSCMRHLRTNYYEVIDVKDGSRLSTKMRVVDGMLVRSGKKVESYPITAGHTISIYRKIQ